MKPFDALLTELPAWMPYAPALLAVTTTAAGSLLSIAVAIFRFRVRGRVHPEHWTETARRSAPLGSALSMSLLINAVLFGFAGFRYQDALFVGTGRAWAGLAVLTSVSVHLVATAVLIHKSGRVPVERWLHSELTAWLVRRSAIVVLLLQLALGPVHGWPARVSLVVSALLIPWLFVGGGLQVARVVGWVRPAPEPLQRAAGDVPVWVMDSIVVNAFVYSFPAAIVFTSRAVDALTLEEQLHILRHEQGHLTENTFTKLLRYSGVPYLVLVGWLPTLITNVGWEVALGVVCCSALPLFLIGNLQTSLETAADAHANHEHPGYAQALETVYRLNLMPVVTATKRRTHPDLYDRMEALGVQPSYARPDPPAMPGALLSLLLPPLLLGLMAVAWVRQPVTPETATTQLGLGLTPTPFALVVLGNGLREEHPARARPFFRAAVALAPDQSNGHLGLAYTAAVLGDAGEARHHRARALELLPDDDWSAYMLYSIDQHLAP